MHNTTLLTVWQRKNIKVMLCKDTVPTTFMETCMAYVYLREDTTVRQHEKKVRNQRHEQSWTPTWFDIEKLTRLRIPPIAERHKNIIPMILNRDEGGLICSWNDVTCLSITFYNSIITSVGCYRFISKARPSFRFERLLAAMLQFVAGCSLATRQQTR